MHKLPTIPLLILAAPLFAAEITGIGERAFHVVLSGSDREASIPNPDGLDIFITSAKGKVCWDPDRHPDTGCTGPGGSNVAASDGFIDPDRPAGALVSRTEGGRTRLTVNDRDTDAAFATNTGEFEFDVFLAPREAVESGGREWIRNGLVRLETAEARRGIADLEAVQKMVGSARVVALGEATHGTREFFQLKHRMLELMASEGGSIVFAIEGNMPEAYRLNDYVLNGNGDPVSLMRSSLFNIWNTEEVLELVRWIREYNVSGRGRIQFTGFDMQQPALPALIARQFAARADPELVPDLDRFYAEVMKRMTDLFTFYGNPQAPTGLAAASLPVSAAPEGKRVRFSGYIKTQDVYRGQASLWWRVVAGGQTVVNETMAGRGASGNSDWKRYEIELTMPAGASIIDFGVMHAGNGTAWFDNLAVEVDGVPLIDEQLDFDFESGSPRGFSTSGASFAASLDNTTAQRGEQSLRLHFDGFPPYSEVLSGCAAIVERMEANRASYLSQGITAVEAGWGIQNARLVWQFVAFLPSLVELRDKFMADNIAWIAAQNPDSRIVVWAHNAHVAVQGAPYTNAAVGLTSSAPMGAHLRSMFGPGVVVFGFGFHQGSFRAFDLAGGGSREFRVTPPPAGSLDAILGEMGVPLLALDFRAAPRTGPGALVRQTLPVRQIGSVYDARIPAAFLSSIDSAAAYDVVLFVESTAAARPIQ